MTNLIINILLLFAGLIGIGIIIQINFMLMLRQWQAFEAKQDPSEAFKLSLPEFISDKQMEKDLLGRG